MGQLPRNGQIVGYSNTYVGGYEFVEFAADANVQHDIVIKFCKWWNASTYYAITWNFDDYASANWEHLMRSSWHFVLAAALLPACSSPRAGSSASPVDVATVATQEDLADSLQDADGDSGSGIQTDDSLLAKPDALGDNVPSGDLGVDAMALPDAASSSDVAANLDGQDAGYEKPGPDAQPPEPDVIIVPPAPPVLEGCKDVRQKHDNKVFWDNCWDPPHHYCSMGDDAAMIWIGCKPGTLVCCQFPSSCIPCGWLHCGPTSGMSSEQQQKCIETAKLWETIWEFPKECKPYMPNYNPICWDGVDPSWGQKAAHWMVDNAAWLNW